MPMIGSLPPHSSPGPASLGGLRILVVEDEYLLAADVARLLEQSGAEVIGPFPTVDQALSDLANGPLPDFALLDVNLRGVLVFPVAELLLSAGVPFLFVTGYDSGALPEIFADQPRLEKPVDLSGKHPVITSIEKIIGG